MRNREHFHRIFATVTAGLCLAALLAGCAGAGAGAGTGTASGAAGSGTANPAGTVQEADGEVVEAAEAAAETQVETDQEASTETAPETAAEETAEGAETGADAEMIGPAPQPLTVWAWGEDYAIAAIREAEKFYRTDHPGFALEITEKSADSIETALLHAAAAGDSSLLPDILLLPDRDFTRYVIMDPTLFTDLTRSGIDFDQFERPKMRRIRLNGAFYGVPFDLGTVCATYRTDLLRQAGLAIDDMTDLTWEEWLQKGLRLKEVTGLPLIAVKEGDAELLLMMMQSMGASVLDKDGNPDFQSSEELRTCIRLYQEAVRAGVILQVSGDSRCRSAVKNGEVIGAIGGAGTLSMVMQAQDQSGLWAVTNMPRVDTSEGSSYYADGGGVSWAITVQCEQLSAAEDFFRSTFGGSVRFYETLLPVTGAIPAYLPCRESTVFGMPREFFGGQSVYSLLMDFSERVPGVHTSRYEREVRQELGKALHEIVDEGADTASALEAAQTAAGFKAVP